MIDKGSAAEVSYYFIGHRNYVHGTSIFESFLDSLVHSSWYREEADGRIAVTQLKFTTELKNNGVIRLAFGDKRPFGEPTTAEMRCQVGGRRLTLSLFSKKDSPVTARAPDRDRGYFVDDLSTEEFGGECVLSGITGHEGLVRGLIEANKQVHSECLRRGTRRAFEIRWIYMRNHLLEPEKGLPTTVPVRIRNIGTKEDGTGRTYTLNKVSYTMGDRIIDFDLCFAYFEGKS